MPAEVQANFHTGIPTTDDQNPLVFKFRTGLIHTGMNHGSTKPVDPENLGNDRLGIFTGSNDEPARNVVGILSGDPPKARKVVEFGGPNGLIEPGADGEMRSVGLHVGNELIFRRVFGEIRRETHERKLTKVLGKMKFKAIVSPILPKRSNTIGFLENE